MSAARVRATDRALVGLLCLVAGGAAVEVILFLPLTLGSMPFPVAVAVAALLLWGLPTVAFELTRRLAAAIAPAATFVVVMVALAFWPRRLMAGYVAVVDWRIVLLFGVASVTASATIGRCWGQLGRPPALWDQAESAHPTGPTEDRLLPASAGEHPAESGAGESGDT